MVVTRLVCGAVGQTACQPAVRCAVHWTAEAAECKLEGGRAGLRCPPVLSGPPALTLDTRAAGAGAAQRGLPPRTSSDTINATLDAAIKSKEAAKVNKGNFESESHR